MKTASAEETGRMVASPLASIEAWSEPLGLDPLTPIMPPPSRIEDAIRQARPLSLDPLSPLHAPRPCERPL